MQRVGRKTLVESPSESIVSLSEYNFIMYKIDRLFLSNDKKLFDQMHLIIFFLFTLGIGKDRDLFRINIKKQDNRNVYERDQYLFDTLAIISVSFFSILTNRR